MVEVITVPINKIVHKTKVDFCGKIITYTDIHLMQYDNSLPYIEVELYKNEVLYSIPQNASIKLRYSKRDGTFVYTDVIGCDETRTKVYVEVIDQMTYLDGIHNPILELIINGEVAGSGYFKVTVDKNPIQDGDIESHVVMALSPVATTGEYDDLKHRYIPDETTIVSETETIGGKEIRVIHAVIPEVEKEIKVVDELPQSLDDNNLGEIFRINESGNVTSTYVIDKETTSGGTSCDIICEANGTQLSTSTVFKDTFIQNNYKNLFGNNVSAVTVSNIYTGYYSMVTGGLLKAYRIGTAKNQGTLLFSNISASNIKVKIGQYFSYNGLTDIKTYDSSAQAIINGTTYTLTSEPQELEISIINGSLTISNVDGRAFLYGFKTTGQASVNYTPKELAKKDFVENGLTAERSYVTGTIVPRINNVESSVGNLTERVNNIEIDKADKEYVNDQDQYILETADSNAQNYADTKDASILQSSKNYTDSVGQDLQEQIDAITSSSDVVDVVATKAELDVYDTSKLHANDIVKVLQDESRLNAITYYRWDNNIFNYVGSQGPFYTKEETDEITDDLQDQITENNNSAVHKTGAENISGVKSFTNGINITGKINNLTLPNGTHTLATLDDIPQEPIVNDSTVQIKMNGSIKGSFTTNQANDSVIDLGTIPDTNTSHTHTAGSGLKISGNGGVTGNTEYSVNTDYITNNKNYKVQVDATTGGLYVNVPWDSGSDTNYYHSPVYDSGLNIGTGVGVNDIYVPNATATQKGVMTVGSAGGAAAYDHDHDNDYLGKHDTADDSDKLGGHDSSYFAKATDIPTVGNGKLIFKQGLQQLAVFTANYSGEDITIDIPVPTATTDHYHVPAYSSGLKIGTAQGQSLLFPLNDMYVPQATSSQYGVVKLGATGGAATYDHDHDGDYLPLHDTADDSDKLGGEQPSYYLDYNHLTNKPTIPTVYNSTVIIKQGGVQKGSFTLNQNGNTTIELDSGSGGSNLPQYMVLGYNLVTNAKQYTMPNGVKFGPETTDSSGNVYRVYQDRNGTPITSESDIKAYLKVMTGSDAINYYNQQDGADCYLFLAADNTTWKLQRNAASAITGANQLWAWKVTRFPFATKADLPDMSTVVHKSGVETINGVKTFNDDTILTRIELKNTSVTNSDETALGKYNKNNENQLFSVGNGIYDYPEGISFDKGYVYDIPSYLTGIITLDVKFINGSTFYFILGDGWSDYYGYFGILSDGTTIDSYQGVTTTVLSDGYIRISINLNQVTKKSGNPSNRVNLFYVHGSWGDIVQGLYRLQPSKELVESNAIEVYDDGDVRVPNPGTDSNSVLTRMSPLLSSNLSGIIPDNLLPKITTSSSGYVSYNTSRLPVPRNSITLIMDTKGNSNASVLYVTQGTGTSGTRAKMDDTDIDTFRIGLLFMPETGKPWMFYIAGTSILSATMDKKSIDNLQSDEKVYIGYNNSSGSTAYVTYTFK